MYVIASKPLNSKLDSKNSKLYTFVNSPKFSTDDQHFDDSSENHEITFDRLHTQQMWHPEIALKQDCFYFYQSQILQERTSIQNLKFVKQFQVKFDSDNFIHFYSQQDKTIVFGTQDSDFMFMLQVNTLTTSQIQSGEIGQLQIQNFDTHDTQDINTKTIFQQQISLQKFKAKLLGHAFIMKDYIDPNYQTDKDDYVVQLMQDDSFKHNSFTLNNFGFHYIKVHGKKIHKLNQPDHQYQHSKAQLQQMFQVIKKKYKVSTCLYYRYISR